MGMGPSCRQYAALAAKERAAYATGPAAGARAAWR